MRIVPAPGMPYGLLSAAGSGLKQDASLKHPTGQGALALLELFHLERDKEKQRFPLG
mgnify:CR=1|jgi:hypothetical protein